MDRREARLAQAAWIAVCIFWGTTYLAIRIGVQTMPPFLFNGLRVLAAGLLLLGWLRARGQALPLFRDWFHLGIVGVALLGVGNGMVAWASKWVPSGMAALLVAMSPFWMIGVEALVPGGERPSRQAAAGLLLGLGGLALLMAPHFASAHLDLNVLLGFAGLQLGCISWSAGSIYARRRPVPVKPLMGAAVQMVVGGAAVSLLGTVTGEWSRMHPTTTGMTAFVYLMVFGSIVGYGSYIYALQKLPVSTVSLYAYVNPVIAVALGWLVLGEHLGWMEGLAVVVILAGVALVKSAGPAKRERPAEDAERRESKGKLVTGEYAEEPG